MKLGDIFRSLFPSRDVEQVARERLDAWADWLQPLAGETGVGRDPGYEDTFFHLRDEAAKLSDIDDALIVACCERLTKETGKDLRVAAYYAQARLRQDGPAGFADGLELAAALTDRFGEAVMPVRPEAKKGALEMLATTRMVDLLERRGEFAPADLERAIAALDVLVARTQAWPEAARPNLQPLVSRFQRNDESTSTATTQASPPVSSVSAPTTATLGAIASTRDLLEQARVMATWLRDQENGYLSSVRLVRSVRWDTLHEVPPADAASRTRLIPPRAELRQQMTRLVLQKQWSELLERVEGAFMEGVNHLWFDLQYFQHHALDHLGAPYDTWREQLRADFALFLERLPGIERLAFNDGTAYADDTTLEWIARHAVVRDLEAGETPAPLPVSAADDGSAGDWPEIEAQAKDMNSREGVEAAFAWLEALPGMKGERHHYLQRLIMARLAEHAGRPDMACALLTELDAIAQTLPLTRWEPALIFEIKQQLMRVLKAQANRKDADKVTLMNRAAGLQSELAVLDPARALTLS
ncbi:type VI secretion system protein TssA [Paraburkholderia sp. J11-2]|uniref:type VI secretion system protein TssA n=1 Tax=Paraburkholderia sp. J11-2 TaxID=2805431 RepID=UPI002AB718EE|nr:type VI secretion system protein TssA [Paraburkholderia sp. J11-2]